MNIVFKLAACDSQHVHISVRQIQSCSNMQLEWFKSDPNQTLFAGDAKITRTSRGRYCDINNRPMNYLLTLCQVNNKENLRITDPLSV